MQKVRSENRDKTEIERKGKKKDREKKGDSGVILVVLVLCVKSGFVIS